MNDVQLLPLAFIHRDERSWPRDGLDQERVEDFARLYQDGGPFALDPVQVILPLSGTPILVNGWHRFAARQEIGATDIAAVFVDHGASDPLTFAYEYGLLDSARSALPLTRAEKRQAVLRLVGEPLDRTDVAIAGLVGVSTKTVQRARKWLADNPAAHEPEAASEPTPRPVTAQDVARTLVSKLDQLWTNRPLGMAMGLANSAGLGDVLGEAFVDRVGAAEAVRWTERLQTWAARAHAVAVDAVTEVR